MRRDKVKTILEMCAFMYLGTSGLLGAVMHIYAYVDGRSAIVVNMDMLGTQELELVLFIGVLLPATLIWAGIKALDWFGVVPKKREVAA